MFRAKVLLVSVFLLVFAGSIYGGPNANTSISIDLVPPASLGNGINDGVTSGKVSGRETDIFVEVFGKGINTPLFGVSVEFDFDEAILGAHGNSGENPIFANSSGSPPHIINVYDYQKSQIDSHGFLMRVRFSLKIDVTDKEFTLAIKTVRLRPDAIGNARTDVIHPVGVSIQFNSTPAAGAGAIRRKNMLPGDLNGDGLVNYADLVIFTNNFGRIDGDTFNPADLIEAALIPAGTAPVTITVYETITRYIVETVTDLPRPDIVVNPGAWDLSVNDMDELLTGVRDVFGDHLLYPFDSDIIVKYKSPEGPRVLYSRASDGSYIIWLDVREGAAQPIFQFAHEYAHILSNYRDATPYTEQLWFEESIAALASFYGLKEMEKKLGARTDQNGQISSMMVRMYHDNLRASVTQPANFFAWYQANKTQLESNPHLRGKNNIVAVELLDIFALYPDEAWNAVRYMNRGSIRAGRTLTTYLNAWWDTTPKRWQFIVEHVMARFRIPRLSKPAIANERTEEGRAGK